MAGRPARTAGSRLLHHHTHPECHNGGIQAIHEGLPAPAEPGGYVLRRPDGGPVDCDRFCHAWRRATRAAGVPGLRYHALRHTFASTLLSRGVSVKAVADWLGHANPTVTLTTYAHLMPADEEVARSVLDAALAPRADTVRTAGEGQAV